MPKIRRRKLPEPLLIHLVTRVRERRISAEQITLLACWPDTEWVGRASAGLELVEKE